MDLKYNYNRDISYETYLFHEGKNYKAYKFLGAHKEKNGVSFTVWAPRAREVYLIGDFNGWNRTNLPLQRFENSGIWQIVVENVNIFDSYKYRIITETGEVREKSDPFAFHSEERPKSASKYFDIDGFKWTDKSWIKKKDNLDLYNMPLNIYEVNLYSWKKNQEGKQLSYEIFAKDLISYVKKMGYTHIELMPIMEHPHDGSWGYQVTGFYAPTSRYGTPHDFMALVNECHKNNIGIILDWVPVHFAVNDYGLERFDGTYLYESLDKFKSQNAAWGTYNFDYTKGEVRSFLISNAMYWHEYYHIDGLRVDAVAYMLYLGFGYDVGQLKTNDVSVNFLRELNTKIFAEYPKTLMIAEESTAWPNVTRPVDMGGLGFNYKWNMGWMHDILDYMESDPIYRKFKHDQLRFSFTYNHAENYILPLSHDEVVHEKKSLIEKMPGYYDDKFASLRLFFGFMIAHPGKKLTFMGGEFGQFTEWNEWNQLDWFLLEFEKHRQLHEYVKDLNKLYKSSSELYDLDIDDRGLQWVEHENGNESILIFDRVNKSGEKITCIFNFTPMARESYPVGVDFAGKYKTILSSDKKKYGGNTERVKVYKTQGEAFHGRQHGIRVDIAPLSAIFIKYSK